MFVMIRTSNVLVDFHGNYLELSLKNLLVYSLPSNSAIAAFVDSFVEFNDGFRSNK